MEISSTGVLALITAEGVREINYRYLLFESRLIRFDPKDYVAKRPAATSPGDPGKREGIVICILICIINWRQLIARV